MFVVHREPEGKPDMEFRMHESGLHYFDPRDSEFIFVNTVSENKAGFTKRQIKEAEVARSLNSKLNYPSWKDFKWIIRSNQIKDCPVTVDHVDTALKIWGKNVAALKGKTTRTKPDPVARDFVKVPVELLKLHKEVYITADLFFVNKIPFFLMLSRKICFTAINHLADRTVPQIFKVFKEIYQYYLQRGFRITTVHADGEFAPLKVLIESLPGGPLVNLASPDEHVPEIERRIRVVKERSRAARHSLATIPTYPKALDDTHCAQCCQDAQFLYYRKFTKSLTSVGFIIPYDPCVANKIVDGTQMTICFHVDDCKLSHRSSRANDIN
jgi:hypothetical protein